MKKKLFLLTLALAGAASLTIAGCGTGGGHTADKTKPGTYTGIESTESVYGIAAVTSATLLAVNSGADGLAFTADPLDAQTGTVGGTGTDKAQAEAEDFNKYFNMLDTFLNKSETKTVVESNVSTDEALAGYTFKLTVTGRDAAGKEVPHTVYYTETEGKSDTQTETDRDGESTTIVSRTFTLDGVVVMGTDENDAPVYYYMAGTRTELETTEVDGAETETEYESRLVMKASAAKDDPLNYVLLTHTQSSETEPGETETESLYTYEIFEGGCSVETTAVSFESEAEKGETETEYTVAFKSGTSHGIYAIERETKGNAAEIVVEYSIDGATGRFVIVKNPDGTYRYRFSDNSADDRVFSDF